MTTIISPLCKKRLIGDYKLIKKDPHKYIDVAPDDKDMLTWYFLVKGPEFSDFNNGYYIGKIMHSASYPFAAPDFMVLTPNGRFSVGSKICLSNSTYHPDEWSAMWNIHAILTGFLSIMLDDKEHGISHIHCLKEERLHYAATSIEYNKKYHLDIVKNFSRFMDENGTERKNDEQLDKTIEKKPEVKKEPEVVKEVIIKEPEGEVVETVVEEEVEEEPLHETNKIKDIDLDNLLVDKKDMLSEEYKEVLHNFHNMKKN